MQFAIQALLAILAKMIVGLLNERFVKQAIIILLEKIAASTKTEIDDQLLKAAKEAWEEKKEENKKEEVK